MNDLQKDNQTAVILAIEASRFSATSIDIAVAIAASMNGRLHGRFIQNDDLLRVASLPFTREISLTTAEEYPTDFDLMQRSLQSMASVFKRTLKQAAQAARIPWSFDYVSSSLRDKASLAQAGFSFTIIGQRISGKSSTRAHRRTRRVLLVEDHAPNMVHALQVVLHQFNHDKVQLTRVNPPESGLTAHRILDDFLAHTDFSSAPIVLPRDQLPQVLDQYAGCYDCAIVSATDTCLQDLLDKIECPLIVVS